MSKLCWGSTCGVILLCQYHLIEMIIIQNYNQFWLKLLNIKKRVLLPVRKLQRADSESLPIPSCTANYRESEVGAVPEENL